MDELCERYFTVVMEGLRRAVKIVNVDAIGFGEDFAFKTGPQAVAKELAPLAHVIREGGYIPGIDHSIPADVSWDNYRRYLDQMIKAVELDSP